MELFEKSLRIIELPTVLELLAGEAVCDSAKERARQLRPSTDAYEIRSRLGETSAAAEMMVTKGSPSFSGVKDIRSSLARADMGGMLNTRELLDIAGVLSTARGAISYAAERGSRTNIDFLFSSLIANRYLEEKITDSIAGEDEIADAASGELADIRRKMRAAGARAREALQRIISSAAYAKALQEPIITTRSDRFVVPVRVEHKGAVPGLVHDISASGATVFIEPMAAVKANNELRELRAKEKQEIERILMELSAECASFREDIVCDFNVLTTLDLIFAKAKLGYKLNCTEPELTERQLLLKKARHPLLDQKKAVPINISLGEEFDTLVITGPNTGGKTVTLKTLGLLCVMTQCGLHIPAGEGSKVPVLEGVLADIGDEQSIEQSLSTFSAHMTNIVGILKDCGGRTLMLFDELGAGTDPTEGAALAISIIEYGRRAGALIAATTHYAELKVYATSTPGVQNASCEFDVETLRPTYRLLIGIPGKSNAFAISRRLGLPETVIEDASGRIGTENVSFEATIEKLELQRQSLERQEDEVRKKLREAEENAKKSDQLRRELIVRLEKADEKARREAERILTDARREAEAAMEEIDRIRRLQETETDHQRVNDARAELRRRLNEAVDRAEQAVETPRMEQKSARPVQVGDTVQLRSMGVKAQVAAIAPDRTLTLQAGIMRVTAKEEDVLLLDSAAQETRRTAEKAASQLRTMSVSRELDIRGMMTDEAIPVVERYIDSASMARLSSVTIIHGKGTGALRQAVTQSLKKHRQVKSFRLGRYGEGENGVTVVELK